VESGEYAFIPSRPAVVIPYLGDVFREGTLELQLRNYYFHRYREDSPDSETWAQGGGLSYDTPWWKDRLRLGSTLYGSLKLYGPDDKGGSKLLKPVQQSFGVLGEAYLEARLYRDLTFKAYRQKFAMPYLNGNDIWYPIPSNPLPCLTHRENILSTELHTPGALKSVTPPTLSA